MYYIYIHQKFKKKENRNSILSNVRKKSRNVSKNSSNQQNHPAKKTITQHDKKTPPTKTR